MSLIYRFQIPDSRHIWTDHKILISNYFCSQLHLVHSRKNTSGTCIDKINTPVSLLWKSGLIRWPKTTTPMQNSSLDFRSSIDWYFRPSNFQSFWVASVKLAMIILPKSTAVWRTFRLCHSHEMLRYGTQRYVCLEITYLVNFKIHATCAPCSPKIMFWVNPRGVRPRRSY